MFKIAKVEAWKLNGPVNSLNGPVNSQEAITACLWWKMQELATCECKMGLYFLHFIQGAWNPSPHATGILFAYTETKSSIKLQTT